MHSKQRIITAARAVTVAGVAGGAMAVGIAAYQPSVAPELADEPTASVPAAQVIPFDRALRRSLAHNAQSDTPG